jgi:hypothetical protein
MAPYIEESDLWWFGMLYDAVIAFADAPENTISRIGGGRINVTDDFANQLWSYSELILKKYPTAADLAIMRLIAEFDEILTRRSRGRDGFEEKFWTNRAFQRHPDWYRIRERAREFLLR